jgi:hypothetical protein
LRICCEESGVPGSVFAEDGRGKFHVMSEVRRGLRKRPR